MADTVKRFDIPTSAQKAIDVYRAFRAFAEKKAKEAGETLDQSWYEDSPTQQPHLYVDQPEVLAKVSMKDIEHLDKKILDRVRDLVAN